MIAHYAVGAASLAVNCTSETEPQMVVAMDAQSAAYWAWKARNESTFLLTPPPGAVHSTGSGAPPS
jgi:hypothetical protein